MPFTNDVLSPQDFPRYGEATMTQIDSHYWKVIQWQFLIALTVLAAISLLFFFVSDLRDARWYVVSAFTIILLTRYLLTKAAFERRSYAVREHDVIYRHGILSVITTIVPFSRIQHVALMEGFIERKYKVATIRVYTAGGTSADIKIAGLPREHALALKEIILGKIKK